MSSNPIHPSSSNVPSLPLPDPAPPPHIPPIPVPSPPDPAPPPISSHEVNWIDWVLMRGSEAKEWAKRQFCFLFNKNDGNQPHINIEEGNSPPTGRIEEFEPDELQKKMDELIKQKKGKKFFDNLSTTKKVLMVAIPILGIAIFAVGVAAFPLLPLAIPCMIVGVLGMAAGFFEIGLLIPSYRADQSIQEEIDKMNEFSKPFLKDAERTDFIEYLTKVEGVTANNLESKWETIFNSWKGTWNDPSNEWKKKNQAAPQPPAPVPDPAPPSEVPPPSS